MYKMLVVDDESLTRDYLKLTIPQINAGWEVAHLASDGKEALELLDQHDVDLILTDIKMPVMDGLTLCKIVSHKCLLALERSSCLAMMSLLLLRKP